MDRALLLLWKLQWHSRIRSLSRAMSTPLGAILSGYYLLIFVVINGMGMLMFAAANELPIANNALFAALASDPTAKTVLDSIRPNAIRTVTSTMLAVSFILSILWTSNSVINFSAAEVDYLFAGPFSRRDLLTYKISAMVVSNGIVSMLATTWLVLSPDRWLTACLGLILTLAFVQLLSIALVLIRQTVFAHVYTLGRRLVLITVLIVCLASALESLGPGTGSSWWDRLRGFQASWAWEWFVAPFGVFGRAMTAERILPDFVLWGTIGLLMNIALFALIAKLDANYFETALATAQKYHDIMQRFRRSGKFVPWKLRDKPRIHLPQFCWMGGAGPIAWRQLTNALRAWFFILVILLIGGLVGGVGPLCAITKMQGVSKQNSVSFAIFSSVMISMMASFFIRYDFRGDIQYMDWLKMLPLRPAAIVVGELITPILITTALQLVLLCVVPAFLGSWHWSLLVVVCFTLPVNVLQFATDNFCFLLFPTRLIPTNPGDIRHLWRHFVACGLKFIVAAVAGLLSASIGAIAYWLSGWYWQVFAAVSWSVLIMTATAIVPCTAWAFRRFDISRDLPPET